jgi:hypothetical protein
MLYWHHQIAEERYVMSSNMQQLLNQIVVPAALVFLMVGGAAGVTLGLGLVFNSTLVMRMGTRLNQWVSFRQVLKPMEITRDTWQLVERNRRWLAIAIAVGGIYTIVQLRLIDSPATAARLAERWHVSTAGAAWLVQSALWFLVLGNVLAILTGLMLGFVPTTLARIDAIANRWISTRNALRSANASNSTVDQLAARWPRVAGALICVFSVVEILCVARAMH